MKLYRITKEKYAADLRGMGGLYEAGRWHREGTQIVYTSEVVSLTKLEVLVHWKKTPTGLVLVTIEVPDDSTITHVELESLPPDWEKIPYMEELADITEQWIRERKFWIMRVPSAQSPTEFNYLLNPLHPEHATLKLVSIEPHPFDPRLK